MWTRPEFRQRGGGVDWMQVADLFIPGNVWNSRTDRFRPLGIAEGLTGIPVDTANELYNRFGGDIGGAFRSGGNMLSNLRNRFRSRPPRINAIRSDQAEARRQQAEDDYYRNWDQSGQTRGGAGLDARRNRLGMGVLGSQGFANQMYYENAIRNRGGALMER